MRQPIRFLFILLGLIFAISPLNPQYCLAADGIGDQLARDIDRAIRTAEKAIISGNFQERTAIIKEVAVKLEELKAVDPNDKRLMGFTDKFSRLQEKLDKTGVGAATPPPASTPTTGAAPATGQTPPDQTLSAIAGIALGGMKNHLDRAEKAMADGTGDLGKKSLSRAADKYQELVKRFPDLMALPEVVAAKQRLDTLLAQIEQASAQQQLAK